MRDHIQRLLLRFGQMISPHRGATAVEYGLILFAIAGVIVGVVTAIGAETGFGFGSVNDNYTAVKPPTPN